MKTYKERDAVAVRVRVPTKGGKQRNTPISPCFQSLAVASCCPKSLQVRREGTPCNISYILKTIDVGAMRRLTSRVSKKCSSPPSLQKY